MLCMQFPMELWNLLLILKLPLMFAFYKFKVYFHFVKSSRFLRRWPPPTRSGISESLFGRVWSQSEWREALQPTIHPGLAAAGCLVTFNRHHCAAKKCSAHWRNSKSFLTVWNLALWRCSFACVTLKEFCQTVSVSMPFFVIPRQNGRTTGCQLSRWPLP